jgi:hypothetical protein
MPRRYEPGLLLIHQLPRFQSFDLRAHPSGVVRLETKVMYDQKFNGMFTGQPDWA